jgi:GNAT superfamily N-acetyltransferase
MVKFELLVRKLELMERYKLVDCNKEYWEFVRNLRNDERVLEGFINTTHITPEMQENYMKKYSECYWITLFDNKPSGFIGVIEDDIRVCTHPDYQGKGIGKFMINTIMELNPTAFAKIKVNNKLSLKMFESCGFTKKYYILTKD